MTVMVASVRRGLSLPNFVPQDVQEGTPSKIALRHLGQRTISSPARSMAASVRSSSRESRRAMNYEFLEPTEDHEEIQIVKEVDNSIRVKICRAGLVSKFLHEIEVVEEIYGEVAVEICG